jgi:hypothetical protein
MTRYRNEARLQREDQEIVELENQVRPIPEEEDKPQVVTPVVAADEEETFKKRYGDLRRYNQQMLSEKDARIQELENKLASTPKGPEFPKTLEEVEAWGKKYPDVFGHIQTMILKNNKELEAKYQTGINKVQEIENKIKMDEAVAELNRLHPDFFKKILPTPEFKEWVEGQPAWMVDVLNGWDAIAASRVIDLYKADMGIGKKESKPAPSKREAAESVTRTISTAPDPEEGEWLFSESQIDKMNPREYERKEAAIMEAMRAGKIKYDLTGAGR